ncbi:MAG: beta-lactamase family protein [Ferruginibacter sp.]|nr:beta-lactamase family protein [Chitinophagaceae bacterium]
MILSFLSAFSFNGGCQTNDMGKSNNIHTTGSLKDFTWLIQMLNDSSAKYNFPGFAIGIVKDGEVIFTGAVGWADRKRKIKTTTETVYQIGSLTKTFTGNVLAHLVNEKIISIDAKVSTYFPTSVKFPVDSTGREITIKDIATHSSGLPRYPSNLDREDGQPMMGYTKKQLYEAIPENSLERNIGARYVYSNYAYGILGSAMENVTGKTYSQLLQQYIFQPIGMTYSSGEMNERIKKKLATPYYDDNPDVETKPWVMGALTPHGGMFSTVTDLCKFIIHFMDTTQPDIKIQQHPYFRITRRTTYGMGIFISTLPEPVNSTVMEHGGDLDSYASDMKYFPDKGLGYIILSNGAGGRGLGNLFNTLENEIFKRYADKKF